MATSLNDETQVAVGEFISDLPEEQQQIIRATFKRLSESDFGAEAKNKGDHAPDFTLPGVNGNETRLADLLEQGPVVISFFRGGWCQVCNLESKALHDRLDEMKQLGATLIGISPELVPVSEQTVKEHNIDFLILSDVGNKVAKDFGLIMSVDEEIRPLYQQWGVDLPAVNGDDSFELPIPATYVIDQSGKIRAAYVNKDYTKRMETAEIIAALKNI